jgi:hypothetical protein
MFFINFILNGLLIEKAMKFERSLTTHVDSWAFDLELLYVALRYHNTPVGEVAINWHEVGKFLNITLTARMFIRF